MFEQLPEPKRIILSAEQTYSRSRTFAVVINFFVMGYNLVHKMIMPLYVNWAARVPSLSVHHLDWWWLYHLVLYVLLRRRKWDDTVLKFFICLGFGGVFLQVYISFKEFSWHIVSFWFTAAATIGVLSYVLSISRHRMKRSFATLLILLMAFISGNMVQFALMGFKTELMPHFQSTKKETVRIFTERKLEHSSECGMTGFVVHIEQGRLDFNVPLLADQFEIRNCGLPVALARISNQTHLQLVNSTEKYLNLKFSFYSGGRWRAFSNVPLRPGITEQIDFLDVSHDVVMVFSDAHPEMGVTLLIQDVGALFAFLSSVFQKTGSVRSLDVVFNRDGVFRK